MHFGKRTRLNCVLQIAVVAVALMFTARTSLAQDSSFTNRALKLDGNGSYLTLPSHIFTNLTEATVEVWAKWNEFSSFSRVFEFGAGYNSVSLFNHSTNSDLRFNIYPRYARTNQKWMFTAYAKAALRVDEWTHIAAVSGPGGMKLYANGRLVAQHTNTTTFADIHASHTNFLGRGLARGPTDKDFRGEIDEVRVWDHQRTLTQIRDNMFKRLSGREEGLINLWNFDDGTASDSGPNANDGTLMGRARIGRADLELALAVVPKPPAPVVPTNPAPEPAPVPVASAPASNPPAAQAAVPIHVAVTAPPSNSNSAIVAIICSAISVGALAVFLMLLFRRNQGPAQLTHNAPAQIGPGDGAAAPVDPEMRERALADLTDFAKQSLVQGLYTQRAALLEVHQKAQEELAALEARVVALRLPERIAAYEKRIAELEAELVTRGDELRELTLATLNVLREKLEEEKKKEAKPTRFN